MLPYGFDKSAYQNTGYEETFSSRWQSMDYADWEEVPELHCGARYWKLCWFSVKWRVGAPREPTGYEKMIEYTGRQARR